MYATYLPHLNVLSNLSFFRVPATEQTELSILPFPCLYLSLHPSATPPPLLASILHWPEKNKPIVQLIAAQCHYAMRTLFLSLSHTNLHLAISLPSLSPVLIVWPVLAFISDTTTRRCCRTQRFVWCHAVVAWVLSGKNKWWENEKHGKNEKRRKRRKKQKKKKQFSFYNSRIYV